jgi:hypothetical protein
MLLMDLEEEDWKQTLFLSSHTTQRTTPLTVSTIIESFKGILQSKFHKSCKVDPWKLKKLCLAIHYQIELIQGHVTKKWSEDSSSEQKTH